MDSIEQGRDAWGRLRGSGQKLWSDWVLVAHALAAGREHALRIAQTNSPHGKKYTLAMRQWLDANGFGEMSQPERHSCHRLFQNLPAITAWRDSLPEHQRRKINHPDSAYWGHQRSISRVPTRRINAAAPAVAKAAEAPKRCYKNGSVHWNQDTIRRAAMAMRDSRSSDFFVLARVALEAAIRNSADLDALLYPPSACLVPHQRSRKFCELKTAPH